MTIQILTVSARHNISKTEGGYRDITAAECGNKQRESSKFWMFTNTIKKEEKKKKSLSMIECAPIFSFSKCVTKI